MTVPPLLIAAHGAPSCPPSQEIWVEDLAARVAALRGGPTLGVTLAAAKPFARKAAQAAALGPVIRVYPLFMTDGWFTKSQLPRRLAAAGLAPERLGILQPLGLDPGLPALCAARAQQAAAARGLAPAETRLVFAAHGSPRSPRPAEVTRQVGEAARRIGGFRSLSCGFVDEEPGLEDALRGDGPAVCLPFFATRASHVLEDLPEALEAARFAGPVAEPIGLDPGLPAMIAAAARSAPNGT
ncbi:sirohydrochlorin chelatase [Rhodovulum sp. DZ06]|uniref:sirohydrochlorin chelatase n=1 Tax=Rhodovulum sp. DZ06 TaxID=3425126 RepID=UPI003D32CF8B